METVFWFATGFVFYAYLGYPLLLMAIGMVRNRPVKKGPYQPTVSFIITAYNEEKRIREKLLNALQQYYPRDRFEIVGRPTAQRMGPTILCDHLRRRERDSSG